MTFKQWLRHVRYWFYGVMDFPRFNDESHMWAGLMGCGDSLCMVCQAEKYDPDDEAEDDEEWGDDGFGNFAGNCPECGVKMDVVRPGKFQCAEHG